MTNNLAFLISQPRSGSTLLQAILGTHPEIHTSSEPWIALPFLYALKKNGAEFEFNGSWSKQAIKAFFDENDIDERFYNAALNSFLTALYQKALAASGKKIFLDKTPRYYEIATDLINIFPGAKFIVLYRNPLAVLNSILTTWVKQQADILYYYSRDLLEAPKKLVDFVAANKEKICLVNYEEIVKAPQKEVKRVCEYLEIPFIEDIINYNSDKNWAFGDRKFKGKKAPDTNSIDAWKEQLTDKRTLNFNDYYLRELGEETISAFGYDFQSAFEEIRKLHPNENDYKTWQALVHSEYVVSVEEQREHIKSSLQANFFKALLRRLVS